MLIVGCGPAGLTLAAQLAAFPDIQTCIVEQKDGPLQLGQADGIACRTMEMFEAFGFSERVLKEACWINEVTFWKPDDRQPGKILRHGRVQDTQHGLSEFPHVVLNQARVHDFHLDVMRNSPSRLEPHDALRLLNVAVDPGTADRPLTVQSAHGNLLVIPREGDYLVRLYVEMDKLGRAGHELLDARRLQPGLETRRGVAQAVRPRAAAHLFGRAPGRRARADRLRPRHRRGVRPAGHLPVGHRELALESLAAPLLPAKGHHGLRDPDKVFCPDLKKGPNIFDLRGIAREQGALVVVRADQYIAHVLPLDAHRALAGFIAGFMLPR